MKDSNDIEKIYWDIQEVSEMLCVSISCLRYWENDFKLKVHKSGLNRRGCRRHYTIENIHDLAYIKNILDNGKTIAGAKLEFNQMRSTDWLHVGTPMKIL